MNRVLLGCMLLAGCGGSKTVVCETPDEVLSEQGDATLTCADTDGVTDWIELLAARTIGERQSVLVRSDWTSRFSADASSTRAALSALSTQTTTLRASTGMAATESRAQAVWQAVSGETPLGGADSSSVDVLRRALAPWATDTEHRLILSEMDIEGWIKYASLCREIQGGSPLTLSVSDRVILYREVVDAFEGHTRDEQLAVLSMGPIWPSLQERWPGVTYEIQQQWVEAAPLPGPMTATSLAYASEVLSADLSAHARALHNAMGQLPPSVSK